MFFLSFQGDHGTWPWIRKKEEKRLTFIVSDVLLHHTGPRERTIGQENGSRFKDQVKLLNLLPHLAFHLLVHQKQQLLPALCPASHLQIFTLKAHTDKPILSFFIFHFKIFRRNPLNITKKEHIGRTYSHLTGVSVEGKESVVWRAQQLRLRFKEVHHLVR